MIHTKPNSNSKGKESRYVEVKLEGVPTIGLIDMGSDRFVLPYCGKGWIGI